MHSIDMLPALRELPVGEPRQQMSFGDMMTGLGDTDRAMFAAEFASATSLGMWAVFKRVNVDDRLTMAYEAHYGNDQELYEHWQEMMERGPESMRGFFSGLKGKVAEFNAKDTLEATGYTDVTLASDPTQEGWDINAIDPNGQERHFSVKTGGINEETGRVEYAYDVIKDMDTNPTVDFLVGSEIYDEIARIRPELLDQVSGDIGPDYTLVQGTEEGLNILSANMGLDIPDGVVEMVPYAGAIAAAARLIYSALKTEMQFKAADRTTKNRIQVIQTLTLMSRMGVGAVTATAGGMGGTAAGSVIPGVGNIVTGIGGTLVGAGIGMYLNKRLQPHMMELAFNITGLTHDDLFYYKNKPRIDEVAFTFQTRARNLATTSGF